MKEKKLLIVERSNAGLDFQVEKINEQNQQSDSIVLTGLFTTFNTKNRNGRIYESADFLPHVEALREQIESKRLLGELDHPHGFEIALANVSHVVESLEFDPQRNAIVGKIRLLNTRAGKEAQALVRDGIPLNISSRAAGTVDESGHVRLQQLFTYDLVADPGFANAVLTRVNEGVETNPISDESKKALQAINESYEYINEHYKKVVSEDGFEVYELSEDANTELDPQVTKTADYAQPQADKNEDTLKNNNMEDTNKQEYISYPDFQKYSEHLSEIISELQSAIANYKAELASVKDGQSFDPAKIDNSAIADLIAKEVEKFKAAGEAEVKSEGEATVAGDEKVAELEAKAAAMEEKYDNLEKYTRYLAETLDKSITHQDYIADEANKIIEHNNYLAENMNHMIEHQDYLAENINDTIAYQNYVAEMVDKHIDYTDMLAEEQNKTVAHADYLVEKMNQMIEHQDYIVENVNKLEEGLLEENKTVETPTEEKPVEENKTVETPTEEKPVEENKTVETPAEEKPVFNAKAYQAELSEKLNTLITNVKEQYAETKRLEAEALAEAKKNVETKNFTLINYIPARLQESWSKLSDDRKKEILDESKLFVINNEASAVYFWNTRDLRESKVEIQKIEENVTAQPAAQVNESVLSDERRQAMIEQIQRRMRKF